MPAICGEFLRDVYNLTATTAVIVRKLNSALLQDGIVNEQRRRCRLPLFMNEPPQFSAPNKLFTIQSSSFNSPSSRPRPHPCCYSCCLAINIASQIHGAALPKINRPIFLRRWFRIRPSLFCVSHWCDMASLYSGLYCKSDGGRQHPCCWLLFSFNFLGNCNEQLWRFVKGLRGRGKSRLVRIAIYLAIRCHLWRSKNFPLK